MALHSRRRKCEQIEADFEALLEQVNTKVKASEGLKFLVVVKDPWLIESGFLTPTMKIKWSVLEDTYGSKMDQWYSSRQRVVWEA